MSDAVIIAILTSVTTLVGLYLTYRLTVAKMRSEVGAVKEEVVGHVVALKDEVSIVKTEINGRMSELIETTKAAATAKGKIEGKAEEKKAEQKRKGI